MSENFIYLYLFFFLLQLSTDNTYGYRTENLVRKVWRVEIEYNNDLFKDLEAYFVDCTTGEILGGDAIK